jgi:hypothetical protein
MSEWRSSWQDWVRAMQYARAVKAEARAIANLDFEKAFVVHETVDRLHVEQNAAFERRRVHDLEEHDKRHPWQPSPYVDRYPDDDHPYSTCADPSDEVSDEQVRRWYQETTGFEMPDGDEDE